MAKQYVTDVIGEEYKEWVPDRPVIINAPMGAGKTFFVLNVLLPYVYSQGKTMVYVANRTALEMQVSHDIPEEYQSSIITCSYQEIAYFHTDSRFEEDSRNNAIATASYYILDEAHYFLADASFNAKVEHCFKRLKVISEKNTQSIWVLMTGTIDYLLLQLRGQFLGNPPSKLYRPIRLIEFEIPFLNNPSDYWPKDIYSAKALLRYKEIESERARNLLNVMGFFGEVDRFEVVKYNIF